jgi:hypothetical protein
MMDVRSRILEWLYPGLLAEVDRLRWTTEANFDLHVLPIPWTPATFVMAFENARHMEPAIIEKTASLQDRLNSLIEIYRRSQ